jgi:hypothetical protein
MNKKLNISLLALSLFTGLSAKTLLNIPDASKPVLSITDAAISLDGITQLGNIFVSHSLGSGPFNQLTTDVRQAEGDLKAHNLKCANLISDLSSISKDIFGAEGVFATLRSLGVDVVLDNIDLGSLKYSGIPLTMGNDVRIKDANGNIKVTKLSLNTLLSSLSNTFKKLDSDAGDLILKDLKKASDALAIVAPVSLVVSQAFRKLIQKYPTIEQDKNGIYQMKPVGSYSFTTATSKLPIIRDNVLVMFYEGFLALSKIFSDCKLASDEAVKYGSKSPAAKETEAELQMLEKELEDFNFEL